MCDTLVALPEATADGSVIFGKNSDREPNEAHHLVIVPAAQHRADDVVAATHRTIPQARRTYAALLAKPYWIWGAEMGVNEHGVAIGNEALFTKIKHERQPGLLGMDLLRLGLERGTTAEEAAQVICNHLQQYGQSGQAGHRHKLQYHNSFILADPQQALVLETVGRDWVMSRVKGTRSISNGLTIHQDWDVASPGMNRPGMDIAREYSDFLFTRFSESGPRQCRTSNALASRHGMITPTQAMAVLRDHGKGGGRPGFTPSRGMTGMTVCAHAGFGPVRSSQSVGSMVAHITQDSATVWLTATSAPCLSVFKPVWLAGGLPDHGPTTNGTYDPASLWWRHEDLHRAVLVDYAARAPLVHTVLTQLERGFDELARTALPNERSGVTQHCFAEADEQLSALLAAVREQPIEQRAPAPYRMAWRHWDRGAKRPSV